MTNTIITIGREFGSGGCEIGHKLAEKLGIKCYDKDMLDLAAKESGICQEIFESHDEKPTNSFLYSLVMDTYSMGYSGSTYNDMPINHKIFLAQFDAIKKIANEGPCILVGRCADYVLENENVDVLSVFVYGSVDYRAKRVMSALDITQAKAKDKVLKTDKQRRTYYDYYTSKNWGVMSNYDLCIDAEKFGIEETANMIINAAKKKIK